MNQEPHQLPEIPLPPITRAICNRCQEDIKAETPKEFYALWRGHRYNVHGIVPKGMEEKEGPEPVPAPPAGQEAGMGLAVNLEDLKALRAAGKIDEALVTSFKNEKDHVFDLEKFFHGMSMLEKRIPALVDFGFKVSHAVANYCTEKNINTKQINLGDIFWTPKGDVGFDIIYDPFDISPKNPPEYLKTGWNRLPQLAVAFPCVIELVMTLGAHLSMMIDNKQCKGKDLTFINLHAFRNNLAGRDAWGFKILQGSGRILRAGQAGF